MLKRWLTIPAALALGLGTALVPGPQAIADGPPAFKPNHYTQPGDHLVNGRYWRTSCEKYSAKVVRCRTEIFATKIVRVNGSYTSKNGWVFNNLTYLPAPRTVWKGNNLARNASWTAADGRKWRTECDTPRTGRHACRSYAEATVVARKNGKYVASKQMVFNNMVMFSHSGLAPQTTIPPKAPALTNVPKEQPDPKTPPVKQGNFTPDSRCTGRSLCISKKQRKMAWMVNGKVISVYDVRFGSEQTPTRDGVFKVNWKSRNHVSSLYKTPMPFAMFFSGGQAVHYSPDFARNGYNGASHGCVNVRDYNGIKWLFDTQVRAGDRVVVFN